MHLGIIAPFRRQSISFSNETYNWMKALYRIWKSITTSSSKPRPTFMQNRANLKNVFLQSLSHAQRLQFSVMVVSSRINGTNELRLAKTAAAKASDRITQLKKSNSYRIGRAVTFLPRKAKRAFRRIKNHALGKH